MLHISLFWLYTGWSFCRGIKFHFSSHFYFCFSPEQIHIMYLALVDLVQQSVLLWISLLHRGAPAVAYPLEN
jgi:hypothetical protein